MSLPNKIRVYLNQQDKKQPYTSNTDCKLATALKRKLKRTDIIVSPRLVEIGGKKYTYPAKNYPSYAHIPNLSCKIEDGRLYLDYGPGFHLTLTAV